MKRVSVVLIALIALASGLPLAAGAVTVTPPVREPCTVYVARVEAIDAGGKLYAIALQSQSAAATISGTLSLFATDERYDVPFTDVAVADPADRSTIPVPIVVQFPAAVHLDGAVVAAIGRGSAALRCVPLFSPWTGSDNDAPRIGLTMVATIRAPRPTAPYDPAAISARWAAFRARARDAAPVAAGVPMAVGSPSCGLPYRVATTRFVMKPELSPTILMRAPTGIVHVRVSLDDGSAVTGASVLHSSGDRYLDQAAVDAVKRSEFQSATFRCEPVAGAYVFTVSFGP